MKKILASLTIFAFVGLLGTSCEPADNVEEINIQDEETKHGNDAVVRKKPG